MADFYYVRVAFPHPETNETVITFFEGVDEEGDFILAVDTETAKSYRYDKAKEVAGIILDKLNDDISAIPVFAFYKD